MRRTIMVLYSALGCNLRVHLAINENGTKEKTQIFQTVSETTAAILEFQAGTKERLDVFVDSLAPSYGKQYDLLRKGNTELIARGVKMRFIIQVTKDNLQLCKDMVSYIGKENVRHLDGMRGQCGINESQYIAFVTIMASSESEIQIIKSNVKIIVERQQQIFETFWKQSILAEQKISELENYSEKLMQDETKKLECARCGAHVGEDEPYLLYPPKSQIWCVKCTVKYYMGPDKNDIDYYKTKFKHENK